MSYRAPLQKALFSFVFVVFLMFAAQAHAKDDANIAKLEAVFGEVLKQYSDAFGSEGSTLVQEGNIMVEPGEGYYAVTLPHLSMKFDDGSRTDIGMLAINALPGDNSEQWKMTIAVPTPIIHYDENGKPNTTINIENQRFGGVWYEKLKSFIKIDMHYGNISIENASEKSRILIPDTKMVYNLTQNDKGLWSGPATFVLSDTQMFFDEDNSKARIGEVNIVSNVFDYDIDALTEYQDQLDALNESYSAGDSPSLSSSHVLGIYNLVFGLMGKAWEGFDLITEIKDFELTRPPIPGSTEGILKIDNAKFGFGMNGFKSEGVNLALNFGYDGLEMQPVSNPQYEKITPDVGNFELNISNLPYKEIVELGRSSVQSVMGNPQAGQMVGLQAIVMLPQLLTQAQTSISLKNTGVSNEEYSMLLNALFTANINAVMGMTGEAKTVISGLDGLIQNLNTVAANPDTSEAKKKKIKDALATLTILQMVGQIEKDENGKQGRAYNFELNEQGQMMMNGTDLKMLIDTVKGAPKQ